MFATLELIVLRLRSQHRRRSNDDDDFLTAAANDDENKGVLSDGAALPPQLNDQHKVNGSINLGQETAPYSTALEQAHTI